MDIKKLFGKKVKDKRIGLSMTQDKLSEKIGISPKSLSQIELGRIFVTADNLEAISNALNVQPKDLFDFSEVEEEEMLDTVISKVKHNKKLLYKIYKIIPIIE